MTWRGFCGTVEFDGQSYFGQIADIKDLVTYESTTLAGLEEEFKAAVEAYIAMRAALADDDKLTA